MILTASVLLMLVSCNNSNSKAKQTVAEEPSTVSQPQVENFLGTSEKIVFNDTDFYLSWSSHPNDSYYKQEYIPKDNDMEKYTEMIMVEFLIADVTIKEAVKQKIGELDARKASDKMVNYQISENKSTGEFLLDFMLSDGNGDENTIVEWNAYRYSIHTDKSGKTGLYLFALSKRGYGQGIETFVKNLKSDRLKYVTEFTKMEKPEISVK